MAKKRSQSKNSARPSPKKGKGGVSTTKPKEEARLHRQRSEAARRGWATRRRNEREAARQAETAKRSEAAKRGWETRRRKQAEAEAKGKQAGAEGKKREGERFRVEDGFMIFKDYASVYSRYKRRMEKRNPFLSLSEAIDKYTTVGASGIDEGGSFFVIFVEDVDPFGDPIIWPYVIHAPGEGKRRHGKVNQKGSGSRFRQ